MPVQFPIKIGFSRFSLLLLFFVCALGLLLFHVDASKKCDLVGFCRFQSSTTAALSQSDEDLREELLSKLVENKLLGPSRQVVELKPQALPMRELPPGNTASLYLMYIAYMRRSGIAPAGRTTFYEVAKEWKSCLRFRHRSEHSMCLICQTLKAAINGASDAGWAFDVRFPHYSTLFALSWGFCFEVAFALKWGFDIGGHSVTSALCHFI